MNIDMANEIAVALAIDNGFGVYVVTLGVSS